MARDRFKHAEGVSGPYADSAALPALVAMMRSKILEACDRQDIEALRVPIDRNEVRPLFERGARRAPGEDPIARLKALSFDGKGRETLDLLRVVLRQPFVVVTKGPTSMYVWPAFAVKTPADPSPEERQAMIACVRFADLAGDDGKPSPMQLGIASDGVWHFFWPSTGPATHG